MTVGSKFETFDIPADANANEIGDADMQSFTVPEGEVWYVESVGFDPVSSSSVAPNGVLVGILAAGNPYDRGPDDLARGVGDTNTSVSSGEVTVGMYAYGGDTIFVGIYETSSEGQGWLNARRVL